MLQGLHPMHPGALLRDQILPALGVSKTKLAENLKISRQTLHDILSEKAPVTAQMAVRLGKLCGNGPTIWVNLQAQWDIAQAEKDLADIIEQIPTLQKAG
jgi:antitoxin HigA-1